MKIVFWIIVVLLLPGMVARGQNCSLRLIGHVLDGDTKDKLINATVQLRETGVTLTTDEKGEFTFSGLCKGSYTLVVSHVGCDSLIKVVLLSRDQHIDLLLPHARNTLGEVKVEARANPGNSGFRKQLSSRDLEETKGLTLAEALTKLTGVTTLQTGSTISKPVIHGLHSSRLLTINNGIRQEGQQWGNEHAPEIDPFIAERITVIKGVDELKYGSDAIGGVIVVDTKPLRNTPGYYGEINSVYFTNNRQTTLSGRWEHHLKKLPGFRYRIQGTIKQGANASTPHYRMNNTGSRENNFSFTAGWKKEKFTTELFYSRFATKVGLFTGAHIGNLTDLLGAIAAEKPDNVFLGENTTAIRRPYQDVSHQLTKLRATWEKEKQKFQLLLGGQFNRRKEFDIVRSSTNNRPQLDLSISTYTEDATWEHTLSSAIHGAAGVSMVQQFNSYGGRYFIPNYTSFSFGGYLIETWSNHKWEVQAGLRNDNKFIQTTRLKFNNDTISHNFRFSTLATSINTTYKITDRQRLQLTIGLASRAPYVNELLSDGIHHGTATYEKGDITLRPEHSTTFSAGFNAQNKSGTLQFELSLFGNSINNFIYQQPKPDSPVLTIAGAFPLVEYQQTDALLYGLDLASSLQLFPSLDWTSKLSVLVARNRTLNDWLIMMPANRFGNQLTYTFKSGKRLSDSYISTEYGYVAEQKSIPDERNGKQDYKAPPRAYSLLNVYAATTLTLRKTRFSVGLGIRNALNSVYRDYLNTMRYFVDEMGRNISVRIKIPINSTTY